MQNFISNKDLIAQISSMQSDNAPMSIRELGNFFATLPSLGAEESEAFEEELKMIRNSFKN